MNIFRWLSNLFGLGAGKPPGLIPISRTDEYEFQSGLDAFDENDINPANDLPMIGGLGGMDVEGNPYGSNFRSGYNAFDENAINPANGLPMIGGIGGLDIEGNPYGSDLSHEDVFMTDLFNSGSIGDTDLFDHDQTSWMDDSNSIESTSFDD